MVTNKGSSLHVLHHQPPLALTFNVVQFPSVSKDTKWGMRRLNRDRIKPEKTPPILLLRVIVTMNRELPINTFDDDKRHARQAPPTNRPPSQGRQATISTPTDDILIDTRHRRTKLAIIYAYKAVAVYKEQKCLRRLSTSARTLVSMLDHMRQSSSCAVCLVRASRRLQLP